MDYSKLSDEDLDAAWQADRQNPDIIKECDARLPVALPTILLPQEGRPIGEFALEVGGCLSKKNILFYRPVDRSIVKLEMKPINGSENRVLQFLTLKNTEFITLLEVYMKPGIERFDKIHGTEFKSKSVSPGHAETTLASDQFKLQMPVIERIFNVPMPYLKDGKLVFPKAGYDEVLLSWLTKDAPQINEAMTLEQSKEVLEALLGEFCFVDAQDKVNALAALLTPMCRGLYREETSRVPLVLYEANRPRAGKDYLAGLTGILYEGSAIEDPPISTEKETHDEEFRKRILGTLRSGRNRVHSSNNKGFINSPALEGLVTASYWEDRLLGVNNNLRFPNTLEISISANSGITYTPDFASRCLFIRLFFSEDDPNKRVFKNPNLHIWAKEHRSDIMSALYVLVKTWHDKGMPAGSLPFTSFPEWARVVGGIMEASGIGNPCVTNDTGHEVGGDKDEQDMRTLFELCYDKWPDLWKHKKDIVAQILKNEEGNDFAELFEYLGWGIDEASARMKFGKLFDSYKGREMSGIRMDFKVADRPARNLYSFTKGVKPAKHQPSLAALAPLVGNFIPTYEQVNNIIRDQTPCQSYQIPREPVSDPAIQVPQKTPEPVYCPGCTLPRILTKYENGWLCDACKTKEIPMTPPKMIATCHHCGEREALCALDSNGNRICRNCELLKASGGLEGSL
jgi:hypothetical protein